jgi:MFS transporter, SP family, arabinose:H+ symporter
MSTHSIREKGSLPYLIFLSAVSALGGLLFGFDTVVISGTIKPVVELFSLTDSQKGLFVSIALLGCAIGAAFAGLVSDRFGRKPTLVLSSLLLLLSAVGCSLAWSFPSLAAFRWIGGVGVGVASMVCPLYISETSPPHLRGRLVSLFQFAITIGILLAYFSNYGLALLSEAGKETAGGGIYHWMVVDQVWRGMFFSEAIPGVLFFGLCLFIPETPRFLVSKGREPEALSILSRINGASIARQVMGDIKNALSHETGKFSELFRPGMRKALYIALFLAVFSELSGVTVVLYYGPTILDQAGVQLGKALGGLAIIGFVNVIFTVIALIYIDKWGRRPLLLVGTIGCVICLFSLALVFRTQQESALLFVLLFCGFMAFFAFSIGPIKWVVMSEIFPTRIRGRAVALATVGVWVVDTVYNYLFPVIQPMLGTSGAFLLFGLILLPQVFFVLKIMPETKGRSLENIEEEFSRQ